MRPKISLAAAGPAECFKLVRKPLIDFLRQKTP